MNCEREFDVLDAVMSGRWPDGCDEELRIHAHQCAICVDLIEVAHAVRSEHLAEMQEANVPPSGVVWWKAQRRARQEAVTAAQRAVTAVQTGTIAAAIVIGLAVIGGLGALIARFTDVLDFQWVRAFTPSTDVMILAGLMTLALLTPFAVWLMVHED
jgi:predicted anti-sigma-YlaC factor YlaD